MMTSPSPLPPHQDPTTNDDHTRVTMIEYVTTLIAQLDRRFDTLHQDLKDSIDQRFDDSDLRYQQRFDAQKEALTAALAAQKEAVLCVSMDTPVLCADLVWRSAGELLVGDELIAFDEDPPVRTGGQRVGQRGGRRMRRAVVTGNSLHRDFLLRVNTTAGSVRCNRQHPWLARRKAGHLEWNQWRWIRTEDLQPGDELCRPFDVWQVDRSWDAGWLAGMLDGEGCLCFKNTDQARGRLSVVQRVSDTADQLEMALKSRVPTAVRHRTPLREQHQSKIELEINVRADVMTILGSVRPARLLAAAAPVWEGRPLAGGTRRTAEVTSVESAGTGLVASLSTSTGTYIADGFAVHNTAMVAAERATSKAEVAADKRFESVNEFRQTLTDQTASFMLRAEADARFVSLSEKIDDIRLTMQTAQGRAVGLNSGWVYLLGGLGAAGTIVSIMLVIMNAIVNRR